MVKLTKGPMPSVLANNADDWKAQLMNYLSRDEQPPATLYKKYNHEEIKVALRHECFEKCMYCESRIRHISYEHIEHIRPKARNKYPELTFVWENLGLACQKCNMNKGERYDATISFINPYQDNPPEHFVASGYFLWHKAGNKRAEITEKIIDLNRPELIEQRKERVDSLRWLADIVASAQEGEHKELLKNQLELELAKDKPYSFCVSVAVESLIN